MRDRSAQTDSARRDLLQSRKLAPYEALDVSWVAIIKLANLFPENDEHQRLRMLLDRLPAESAAKILELPAVDALLNLDPPLETVLSAPHERLDAKRTAKELAAVRENRSNAPKVALTSLVQILKRIRNRRAHGFKASSGPRDAEILRAAMSLLQAVGEAALKAVGTQFFGR